MLALAAAGTSLRGRAGAEQTHRVASASQEAPRITPVDLMDKVKRNEAVLIDVRSTSAYALSHAEGAVNIPYDSIEARLGELPKEKLIGLYCT